MSRTGSASKIKLNSIEDLFGAGNAMGAAEGEGKAVEVALAELHGFHGHPFLVRDDEKMEETVESIKRHGVIVPGIVRPRSHNGYEIISGHRRKRACEIAGLETMPVFIREMSDDEAAMLMVDSNIQREELLPSERAKAYKMKYEAMKHQGSRGGNSLEVMGADFGLTPKTVQRFIRLAGLSDGLLRMVDEKMIGMTQGICLSFLTEEEQGFVEDRLEELNLTGRFQVSITQAEKLKEYSRQGSLTEETLCSVLNRNLTVPKQRGVTLRAESISRYFPEDYSEEKIRGVILKLLEEWKSQEERG